MSEQTCINTTTKHSHCLGGGNDCACDESGIVGVLKSGGGEVGLQQLPWQKPWQRLFYWRCGGQDANPIMLCCWCMSEVGLKIEC